MACAQRQRGAVGRLVFVAALTLAGACAGGGGGACH